MGSDSYLLAVYIALPLSIVLLLLVLALCHLYCSRRYRLNWYERTLLDGLTKKHDSEKDFLQRTNEQSHSSFDQSTSGLSAYKQGLPSITIGHGSAQVVTRKVRPQQGSDSASMGSNSSHESDSARSSDSVGVTPETVMTHAEKRVGFSGAGMPPVPVPTARRGSMTAPVLPGGRRGSSSPSNGNVDSRRDSAEFWVPPAVLQKKRAQSLVPSLGLFQKADTSEEQKELTPSASPCAMSSSHPEMTFTYPLEKQPLVETVSLVQVPAHRGRRRASMQDALDPTLINTRIYEQMQRPKVQKDSIGSIQEEERGVISLSLQYDPEQAVLTVKLIQARGLLARDFSGTADPYCKLSLLPNRRHALQSRVHKDTQNPDFDEEFMFSIQSQQVEERTLQVLVYDFDQFSRDECMGQVLIPLDTVDLSTTQLMWKAIAPYDNSQEVEEHGDVMFSLSYLPSAERLTVVVLKARNLSLSVESTSKSIPSLGGCEAYAPLTMELSPAGRVTQGEDVIVRCTIDRNTSPSASVVWSKRQGSFHVELASDEFLVENLESNSRYSISLNSVTVQGRLEDRYTLKIRNAKFEDSGTYECRLEYQSEGGATRLQETLIVCEDVGSTSCKCSHEEGWTSPQCFQEPADAKKVIGQYRGGVIGLVVCLVIVIVYAVVITVYLYRDVVKTLKSRAAKKLEERRARQSKTTSGADDTRTLDLTDNASMISGSAFGQAGAVAALEYTDNVRIYRDDPHEYERLSHGHGYSPRGGGEDPRLQHGRGYLSRGGEAPRLQHGYGYSPRGGNDERQAYAQTVQGEVHVNAAYESDNLPRYEELPPEVRTPTDYHPHSSQSPIYRNPPTPAQYPAADSHHLDHSQDRKVTGYGGVRPKNSPPGRSAFTPVVVKDARRTEQAPPPDHEASTPRGAGSREAATPRSTGSHEAATPRGPGSYEAPTPRGASSHDRIDPRHASESAQSTPVGYGQHPSKYATYDGGLNVAASGAQSSRAHGPTPQSTRSERHPPAQTDIPLQHRGAYSEAPKEKPRNGYGPHAAPAHDPRSGYEPKRLDFSNGHAVAFGDGPHVSQKDTVI